MANQLTRNAKMRVALVERSKVFVGVKEQPAGTNRGPYDKVKKGGIDDWCVRANGMVGYPWCAAFACAMYEDVTGHKLPDPRRASVGFIEAWAKLAGDKAKIVSRPFRGDWVLYNWGSDSWPDHIGIVDRVLSVRWTGGKFIGVVRTIEGNTASGNDANGGQVQVRWRRLDGRQKFVRLYS